MVYAASMKLLRKLYRDKHGSSIARCNLPHDYIQWIKQQGYSTTVVQMEVDGDRLIISPVRDSATEQFVTAWGLNDRPGR